MSKDMLRGTVGGEALGLVKDLATKMLNPKTGNEWVEETKKFLKKQPTWVKVSQVVQVLSPWLKKVGSFSLPKIKEFSAQVFFAPGFWTGDNFKTKFAGYKKSGSSAEKFLITELAERKTGQEIIGAVGADNAVIGLEHIELAIKSGKLKKDKYYIFFVQPQIEGEEVQAVRCSWYSGRSEWHLEANSLSRVWLVGYQFVSRDS